MLEWVSSIGSRSHTSHYIVVDDVEVNFEIRMTNRGNFIHRVAVKDGYDLFISKPDYEWEIIKHGKTVKELKQHVKSKYRPLTPR